MIQTNIDSPVRSALNTMGLSLHWYADALKFGLEVLNERLNYTILPNIKSTRLTVDANGEVTLPDDYVDWVRVGYQYGKFVIPVTKESRFNRMLPADGQSYASDTSGVYPFSYNSYFYGLHTNSYGEFNGRYFGETPKSNSKFIEVRERGVISLDPNFGSGDTIVLDYIYFDSATATALIHPKAAPVIREYIVWKLRQNGRGLIQFNRFEVDRAERDYIGALRLFRAQIQKITPESVLEAVRSQQRLTPKV